MAEYLDIIDKMLVKMKYDFLSSNVLTKDNEKKLVEAIKTINSCLAISPHAYNKNDLDNLNVRERQILQTIINKEIQNGEFYSHLSKEELSSGYNAIDKIVETLSRDYNLKLDSCSNLIKINISKEDLAQIKSGMNKLMNFIDNKIGILYERGYEWIIALNNFISDKLNFKNIQDCDDETTYDSNDFDDDEYNFDFDEEESKDKDEANITLDVNLQNQSKD